MDADKPRRQMAQPAEEELKKHGDQLQAPVEEAAGKKPQDEEGKADGKDEA